MARCEVCGNDYDKAFVVTLEGSEHTFDSFGAPSTPWPPSATTAAAGWLGMGSKVTAKSICCAHCAQESGITAIRDRA